MFKSSKKFMEGKPIGGKNGFAPKKEVEFSLNQKNTTDSWTAKKTPPKPNLRMKAKQDLINEYYNKERINASQYNQFKEHLHHHTKAHIKKMLVEIHRNKKSFKQAHTIAKKIDDIKKSK